MFRRNFRSSGSRFRGRTTRRRFGPRLRISKEPYRWEVAQFALTLSNVTDVLTPNATVVTAFGQIRDRIGAGGSQGRALDNATRWLEIGGVLFRYRIRLAANLQDSVYPTGLSEFVNQIDWRLLLVSDRMDAVGVPVSIPDWFNTTTPIAVASALTQADEDTQYPTRIHWQNYHGTNAANRQGNGTGSVGPSNYTTDQRAGGANLRLRLRLDDEHGLFWHFAQRTIGLDQSGNSFASAVTLVGTMYYRFVFGPR